MNELGNVRKNCLCVVSWREPIKVANRSSVSLDGRERLGKKSSEIIILLRMGDRASSSSSCATTTTAPPPPVLPPWKEREMGREGEARVGGEDAVTGRLRKKYGRRGEEEQARLQVKGRKGSSGIAERAKAWEKPVPIKLSLR